VRGHLQKVLHHSRKVLRVAAGDLRVDTCEWGGGLPTFEDLLVETFHVFGAEGGLESDHLVEDATQGPDVGLGVVRLVAPNLGTGVVRGAGLGVAEALLNDLADVEVTELGREVLEQEDIGALQALERRNGTLRSRCKMLSS
jgi:hypothetical protein